MKDYLLLFRGDDTERLQLSPEEIQADMQRWQDWIAGIAQAGQFVGGEPLDPGGKVLHGVTKKLTDGPFMEGKEMLGGYLIIKARNIDEAVQLSQGCPMLASPTGSVEIRQINTMSNM